MSRLNPDGLPLWQLPAKTRARIERRHRWADNAKFAAAVVLVLAGIGGCGALIRSDSAQADKVRNFGETCLRDGLRVEWLPAGSEPGYAQRVLCIDRETNRLLREEARDW